MDDLRKAITSAAALAERPDGEAYRSLGLQAAQALAAAHGVSLLAVEDAALEQGVIPQRYARNFKAYTLDQQLALLRGGVLLGGLGGLGGGVLELLARAGVGRIVAADGDVFEESNCNRQLLCETATLDRPKSEAAAARVARINPAVDCRCLHEKLDEGRMTALLRELCAQVQGRALAVDALGGLESRPALWRAAQAAGVPLVTAAVAGTSGCMGSFFPGDSGPELLFGAAPDGGHAAEDALGTQGPAVHLAASLEAQETLQLLAEPGQCEGRVLFFDLADLTFERVRF